MRVCVIDCPHYLRTISSTRHLIYSCHIRNCFYCILFVEFCEIKIVFIIVLRYIYYKHKLRLLYLDFRENLLIWLVPSITNDIFHLSYKHSTSGLWSLSNDVDNTSIPAVLAKGNIGICANGITVFFRHCRTNFFYFEWLHFEHFCSDSNPHNY